MALNESSSVLLKQQGARTAAGLRMMNKARPMRSSAKAQYSPDPNGQRCPPLSWPAGRYSRERTKEGKTKHP